MNSEHLLSWMTHTGTGRWAAFRSAVAELSESSGDDLRNLCRDVRIGLSDLGHADFFIEGSRAWRVRQPVLAGLLDAKRAVLTGGRITKIVDSLRKAVSQRRDCSLEIEAPSSQFAISRIVVSGDAKALANIAGEVGIRFIPDAALCLATALVSIESTASTAPERSEPVNWEVLSWSFDELTWVPSKVQNTARLYTNRHGKRCHLVELDGMGIREMPRYEAVFAAAWRNRRHLVDYEANGRNLLTPRTCPLPERFSRSACLASGRMASRDGDHLVYHDVPPRLAWILMDRLGQPNADRIVFS